MSIPCTKASFLVPARHHINKNILYNTCCVEACEAYLHVRGFRYRLHVSSMPGKPDIVMPRYKLCIFIHGCFWHRHDGCKYATTPKTRPKFWMKKFATNRQRDIQVKMRLHAAGWRVFEIWECGFRNRNEDSINWLPEYIRSDIAMLSWPDYVCSGDR
ncbi:MULTISPECIES: DNA mismatch endonuclease Vsr [Serratia]|uniref:very short patch repair endonuclease n=1 Tax=Serratia TaxID=613 RepID=UPI000904586D|nr:MULTISPECIES: DNA mismatch endonuclease Vsr [Serratia]MDI9108159.1 very short patch repair endonuclease [Serratia marcescens]MDR8491466.1 very short patch repair endonuclease [Serratia nevei]MDR8536192.1 very short patch repair endonuclease [Serratia nevei]